MNRYIHVAAGSGLGLLVGTILGMSVSATVGVVLGGIAALLAAFLGLTDISLRQKDETPEMYKERRYVTSLRAASFGVACILGIGLGVFARTHEWLSPSNVALYEGWIDTGIDSSLAEQLVIYEKLNLLPHGYSESTAATGQPRPNRTALYFDDGMPISAEARADERRALRRDFAVLNTIPSLLPKDLDEVDRFNVELALARTKLALLKPLWGTEDEGFGDFEPFREWAETQQGPPPDSTGDALDIFLYGFPEDD